MTTSDQGLAARMLAAFDTGGQMAPITDADPGFDMARATAVSAEMTALRRARGDTTVGRKIGFTNRLLWDEYGVRAPIWGPVWAETCRPMGVPLRLGHLMEPKIEPEVIFRLNKAPGADMSPDAIYDCIGGVALGFEIVQSAFPGWRFRAPDCIAAGALHGALLVPDFAPAGPGLREQLQGFGITLRRDGEVADRGVSGNVMETGPLAALAHLVALLADEDGPPLQPGEIISTGSLTRAMAVAPGETWHAELDGCDLPPVEATFA